MPRSRQVAEDARERGLVYDPATRGAYLPGAPDIRFSRRQFDRMRDQRPPGDVVDDSRAAATYSRRRQRETKSERVRERLQRDPSAVMGEPRLRAAITILRWDAQQPTGRRSQAEHDQFAWALAQLYGQRRVDLSHYWRRR